MEKKYITVMDSTVREKHKNDNGFQLITSNSAVQSYIPRNNLRCVAEKVK